MDGQTNSKMFTRIVVVGLAALAFAGIAMLFANGRSALFTEQSYAPNSAVSYADAR
jgi:hypothetical protein